MPVLVKGIILMVLAFGLGAGVTTLLVNGLQTLGNGLDAFSDSVGLFVGLGIVSIGGAWLAWVMRSTIPAAIAIGMASVAASLGVVALSVMAAVFFFGERGKQPMAGGVAIALALIASGMAGLSGRQATAQIKTWLR